MINIEEFDSILQSRNIARLNDVQYVSSRIQFRCITCAHEWTTTPFKITKQRTGCPKCAGSLKLTTPEFVLKARQRHGDKYNYSRVVYQTAKTKVEIKCHQHGSFFQTPNSHLLGGGCPVCAGNTLDTNSVFDKKLRAADRGVYRIGEYKGSHTPIEVECGTCQYRWCAKPTKLTGAHATGCPVCRTSNGIFGTYVERNGMRFRSILESDCYDVVEDYCTQHNYRFEHQKKYPQSETNHSCDFYIYELQLWLEVSNIKTQEYETRIRRKVAWVRDLNENFLLVRSTTDLRKVLYGKAD